MQQPASQTAVQSMRAEGFREPQTYVGWIRCQEITESQKKHNSSLIGIGGDVKLKVDGMSNSLRVIKK